MIGVEEASGWDKKMMDEAKRRLACDELPSVLLMILSFFDLGLFKIKLRFIIQISAFPFKQP